MILPTRPRLAANPLNMATPAEFTLLCETCGYVLERLAEEGNCPECGRAIASSLPAARAGTPWDRGPSVRSWFATGRMVVRRPGWTFERIRISEPHLSGLSLANAAMASALAVLPATAANAWAIGADMFGVSLPWSRARVSVPWLMIAPLVWYMGVILVMALTSIERAGLRIIGRAHGWRITRSVTAAVCDSASYGWVLAGALMGAASLPLRIDPATLRTLLGAGWQLWVLSPYPLAMLTGLLTFETLVYIGVRRCKFANRARPV